MSNPTLDVALACGAPAACLAGILLHALRKTALAKLFDKVAIATAILVPAARHLLVEAAISLGWIHRGSPELRREAGVLLFTLLLSVPSLLLACSALLISSSRWLSEPLR